MTLRSSANLILAGEDNVIDGVGSNNKVVGVKTKNINGKNQNQKKRLSSNFW